MQWLRSTGIAKYTLFDALKDVSFDIPQGRRWASWAATAPGSRPCSSS
ncbi:hypothetical protein [Nesterenkonia pannonica]|nr:hypothetical protein [Nesterenkonia pannonica]